MFCDRRDAFECVCDCPRLSARRGIIVRVVQNDDLNQCKDDGDFMPTSAASEFCSKEGVIDPNATLAQLGIDDEPDSLTPSERQARVVDLLRARSGIYHQVDFETRAQIAERP